MSQTRVINYSLFIALLTAFLFACNRHEYSNQGKYCSNKNFKILSIEYYDDNTKVVKKIITERQIICNNCQTKIFFVNKSNVLDSTIVDYDLVVEEFEYYPNGNKKYFGVLYKYSGGKYAISWWENGIIQSVGEYSFCIQSIFDTSDFPWTSSTIEFVKNGVWVYYSEKGEIEKTETYENGKIVSTVLHHP
jgi:antitoxin component YwqK of YwqJK toxin-antitoxin module